MGRRRFLAKIGTGFLLAFGSRALLQFQDPPPPSTAPFSSHVPLAPALFVIGDSSVDCGTNNFLGTFARAPITFLTEKISTPTNPPEDSPTEGSPSIILRLGLPFVPSYLVQTGVVEDMIKGVNYASAGAGIILSSGS
uniref:GDSL esterase/lipase n=1 Tax=Glycine max TaxID=3847 RepID=K7LMJ7_SOYBN